MGLALFPNLLSNIRRANSNARSDYYNCIVGNKQQPATGIKIKEIFSLELNMMIKILQMYGKIVINKKKPI